MSKREKRRLQITSRLSKLTTTFTADKDNFYRALLHNLQTSLATLQQGTNEDFLRRRAQLEEARDYELTKLRLWEEYQVKRIETEYKEDIAKAKENHDRIVKLVKEKLYDKLQKQIKQLKEDKLLLNLVNANSWSAVEGNDSQTAALNAMAAANALNISDRRSLRKRELSSRFGAGEAELSDGGGHSTTANGSRGYISASSKRRRHYATRYSSNDEHSSGITSTTASHQHKHGHTNGVSSGNDSNFSDKDYDALNSIIMDNGDGGMSLLLDLANRSAGRPNTRNSHKQFIGVQGLKPEELNDDLLLLRNATRKQDIQ